MSISKRLLRYESTIRSARFITNRLVDETGLAPDVLAEVIGGYFADLGGRSLSLPEEEPEVDDDVRIETPPPRHAQRVVVTFQEDDPRPDRTAGLDDRLAAIDRDRPARKKPPHDGACRWHDIAARPGWFRRCCRLCNRLYGYGRIKS